MSTSIRVLSKDKNIVKGSTMGFGLNKNSKVIVIPRNFTEKSIVPKQYPTPTKNWTTKYAAVGLNAFGQPAILDGVNEAGLSVTTCCYPEHEGYATEKTVTPNSTEQCIAPWQLCSYLLGCCKDVKEVEKTVEKIVLVDSVVPNTKTVPPLRFICYDPTGKCIVIESIEGKLKVTPNPTGVLTSGPSIDWHLTNVKNYINLRSTTPINNTPNTTTDTEWNLEKVEGTTSWAGIPGEPTPAAQFVRAFVYSQTAPKTPNTYEGVMQTFQILNNFEVPKGMTFGKKTTGNTNKKAETECENTTVCTSVTDVKNSKYYFCTCENRQIQVVDLKNEECLDAPNIVSIDLQTEGYQQVVKRSMLTPEYV